MKNKFISALLAGCLAVGCIGPVSAEEITTADGTGTVPVELTAEALTFSVTVPTSLPVHVDADGVVTVARGEDGPKIINNSAGPVEVRSVKVEAVAPWELVSDFADLSTEKVGTDKFSFSVQGANVAADGTCAAEFDVVPAKSGDTAGSISFTYDTKVAPQNEATTDEQMAKVVFTLGWDKAPLGTWDVSKNGDGSVIATLTDDGVMTISGNGEMKEFSLSPPDNSAPYLDKPANRDRIKTVVIKDGVTNIGSSSIGWCNNLTSVTIPDSVTSIGANGFNSCTALKSITIPDSVTKIESGSFSYTHLNSITYKGITYTKSENKNDVVDKFEVAFKSVEGNSWIR